VLRATASVNRAAAGALFKHAGRTVEQAFAASERSEPQAFPLHVEIALGSKAEVSDVRSANVLGWLPGRDPALAGEPLVISSHLDHLGIGPAIDGDTIYNGALDNATGTAIVLAVAEQLARGPRLRRPVLFASVTAEEKGLLGASHLARNPPKQVRRYAANLNIDMPILLAPIRDVVGIGAEHTTLGAKLAAAASVTGFSVSPDPAPDEVVFVRSDQYQFVRAGVPSLYLVAGRKALSGGKEAEERATVFRRDQYHKPSDDLAQPIDWPSAAALAQLAAELARSIADDATAPAWQPGDFFGRTFGAGK
jgi:Zn-dependent M28 family amino/carboxypeptidase